MHDYWVSLHKFYEFGGKGSLLERKYFYDKKLKSYGAQLKLGGIDCSPIASPFLPPMYMIVQFSAGRVQPLKWLLN